jgi:CBS domain-containing protein
MKARDVMVSPVVTVRPSSTVREVAKLFLDHQISGVPVVDHQDKLIGIVSEGDLMHRAEIGTEQRPSWWLLLLADDQVLAADYIKAHAQKVEDVMTREVVTAAPDTPLNEVAGLLEKHAIKRVPIVGDGQLVGIVSRANLVQAFASSGSKLEVRLSDTTIRDKLLGHLNAQRWARTGLLRAHTRLLNVTVNDGVVDLWGITGSETERKAIRVAAEATAGVRAVNDHIMVRRMESLV